MTRNTISLIQTARPYVDDEHREPMGLADRDSCRECHEPILRTTAPGLCWRCMPCAAA